MKIPKLILTPICLAALSAIAIAQTTSTRVPDRGWLTKNGVRYNNKDYTTTQACQDDALAAYQLDRAANPAITESNSYQCWGSTLMWMKTTLPVIVPTSPGLGQLPPQPRLNNGIGVEQISSTSEQALPSQDQTGDFRTRCLPSHYAFDDPIVFPGQVGRSHLHVFFGNTGSNANSTDLSLRTTGNSTCRGGTVNRSSYWVPALIDMASNLPINPMESDFYYKSAYRGVLPASMMPMPAGLRMIAGDPTNKTPPADPYATPAYTWVCHETGANRGSSIPGACPVGETSVELSIAFPQCWDGVNLDSPDHKSHMAYGRGFDAQSRPLGCPTSHPIALPEVSFHVLYPIAAVQGKNVRLSSDTYDGPAGYSTHADWFNGWKKDVSDAWAINCDRAGKDCHSHLLGDGRAIY